MLRITRSVLLTLCAAALLCAQDDPPAQAPAGGGGGRGGFGGGAAAVPDPQPYDRVITKDAKTTKGLFTVHQIKERYYYEIPKNELGKDLLWNSQIAKTTVGAGYGGGQLTDKVIRWELKGNRVLLLEVNYGLTADPNEPIAHGREERQQRRHHSGVPGGGLRQGWRAGDRSDAPVHRRPAGVQRAPAPGRHRRGCHPHLHRAHQRLPRECRSRSHRDLHADRGRRSGDRRRTRRRAGRRHDARQQRHRGAAPQHGATAGEADDAAPVRRARRLLHHQHDGLLAQRVQGRTHPLHRPLAPGKEGPHRRHLRAGEADRLLHRCGDAHASGCRG